jgi:tetratricopeptide (TPR) repeat protein
MNATTQKKNQLMVVILSALCQTDAASQDSDQALVHGERALSICRAMSDPKSTISVLGTIANTHASMNNIKTAVQIHKEQMHLAHRTGNEMSALPCYADIARSYALVQDYDNAIRQSTHRLDLAKKSNSQFEIALALHDIGKLQLKCGSFKRGLKNLEQCVHLHKSDPVHQATAAIEIGHVYCRTDGEHEKGLYGHTMGMKCANKCHNSKYAQSEALAGIAECKMGLAAIVARQTRSGYADSIVVQLKKEASECFSQRKTLSMTLGHFDEACRADIQLGLLFQSTGENKKATESLRSAVLLATTTRCSRSVMLDALVEYGQHALRTLLDGGDGHAHLERAVSCAKDLGRQDILCEVLQIIGRWEHRKGHVHSALARAKESVGLAISCGDPARISGASCLEGMCHLSLNDIGAAVVCFKRQNISTKVAGDQVGRTQALDGLTESYTRLEQFDKAAETAEECLTLMEEMEDCAGEIHMRFKFGVILFHLKWFKHAVENYNRILKLAARVADIDAGRNANLCLSRVMEEVGSELLEKMR